MSPHVLLQLQAVSEAQRPGRRPSSRLAVSSGTAARVGEESGFLHLSTSSGSLGSKGCQMGHLLVGKSPEHCDGGFLAEPWDERNGVPTSLPH